MFMIKVHAVTNLLFYVKLHRCRSTTDVINLTAMGNV